MQSLRCFIASLLWGKDNIHLMRVLQVSCLILMSLAYHIWHMWNVSFNRGRYTYVADLPPGSPKDTTSAFRRARTVNQICLSRHSQQKYLSWFPFPTTNCGKIFMSYSEDWNHSTHILKDIYIRYKNKSAIQHTTLSYYSLSV